REIGAVDARRRDLDEDLSSRGLGPRRFDELGAIRVAVRGDLEAPHAAASNAKGSPRRTIATARPAATAAAVSGSPHRPEARDARQRISGRIPTETRTMASNAPARREAGRSRRIAAAAAYAGATIA